jgi:hypothetical protein
MFASNPSAGARALRARIAHLPPLAAAASRDPRGPLPGSARPIGLHTCHGTLTARRRLLPCIRSHHRNLLGSCARWARGQRCAHAATRVHGTSDAWEAVCAADNVTGDGPAPAARVRCARRHAAAGVPEPRRRLDDPWLVRRIVARALAAAAVRAATHLPVATRPPAASAGPGPLHPPRDPVLVAGPARRDRPRLVCGRRQLHREPGQPLHGARVPDRVSCGPRAGPALPGASARSPQGRSRARCLPACAPSALRPARWLRPPADPARPRRPTASA